MNNNLPIKYKKEIFYKIKTFFSSLFTKNNIEYKSQTTITNNSREDLKNKLYVQEVQNIQKEKNIKKSIIDMVTDNPKLLETMSISNLKKLTKLYDEIIEQNNKRIDILKNKLS